MTAENSDFLRPAVIGRVYLQFETGDDIIIPVDGTWGDAEPLKGTPWGTPANNDIPRAPAHYLRKDFDVSKPVKRATL